MSAQDCEWYPHIDPAGEIQQRPTEIHHYTTTYIQQPRQGFGGLGLWILIPFTWPVLAVFVAWWVLIWMFRHWRIVVPVLAILSIIGHFSPSPSNQISDQTSTNITTVSTVITAPVSSLTSKCERANETYDKAYTAYTKLLEQPMPTEDPALTQYTNSVNTASARLSAALSSSNKVC